MAEAGPSEEEKLMQEDLEDDVPANALDDDVDVCSGGNSGPVLDCRNFRLGDYAASLIEERRISASSVFCARFAAPFPLPDDAAGQPAAIQQYVTCASSSGSVSIYSFGDIVSEALENNYTSADHPGLLPPGVTLNAHEGAAYDLATFGAGEGSLLFSCGDDGRICGWKWADIESAVASTGGEQQLPPLALELRNPQEKGLRGSLCEVPETNAIACDPQRGELYSAAGDSCAYAWNVETQQRVLTFRGHSDYLHCIAARPSHQQVVTGSEDGTARLWDCRSGCQVAALDPWKALPVAQTAAKGQMASPWVASLALSDSEDWLACVAGGRCVTLFNLGSCAATLRILAANSPRALALLGDEIVFGGDSVLCRWGFGGQLVSKASSNVGTIFSLDCHPAGLTMVAGHGGMVDIFSDFGSHFCTFQCT